MLELSNINKEDFIKNFTTAMDLYHSQLGYNINLIDELHANENAHTRILLKLLSYKQDNIYPILNIFISIINEYLDRNNQIEFDGKIDEISGQKEFIDGYIRKGNDWAIIIENKIQWADDQPAQIDRYVKAAEKEVGKDNIYVIYLTDDGRKKITDYSFNKSKEILKYKDEINHGRFIPLNYKEHILPMLYNIQQDLIFSSEILLKSAIFQYIDYLEGRFRLRTRDAKFYKLMNEYLLKYFEIDTNDYTSIKNRETIFKYLIETSKIILTNENEKNNKLFRPICTQFDSLEEFIFPEELRPRTIKIKLTDKLNDYLKKSSYKAAIQWNKYNDWIWITDNDNKCCIEIEVSNVDHILIRNPKDKANAKSIPYTNTPNITNLFEQIKSYLETLLEL